MADLNDLVTLITAEFTAARWIDDRIVDFVRTYLRLHEGQD